MVPEVCQGTLRDLDANLTSLELELGLEPTGTIDVYVLEGESIATICGDNALACTRGAQVFLSPEGYLYRRHELAHARLIGIMGVNSIPLFDEGIAATMDRGGGCRSNDGCDNLTIDELLSAQTTHELFELEGYAAASDLVRGMLDTYGASAVLDFMADVPADSSADAVRSSYYDHFQSSIDDDFPAFKRGRFDEYTLAEQSCEPLPHIDVMNGSLGYDAIMDCASPNVINDFSDATRGQIAIGFLVDDVFAGHFDPTWTSSDGLPEVRRCTPTGFSVEDLADVGPWALDWTLESRDLLGPGWHIITWKAAFGSSLQVHIDNSCTYELQDCPAGEQCDIWNECRPLGPDVAALGDACVQDSAVATCEAGARCLGGTCIAECDTTVSCAEGQACARIGVCGPVCDLLAQDCMVGQACVPSAVPELLEAGAGICVPEGPGFFESCDPRLQGCAMGLTCERYGLCHPTDGNGCCVQLCSVGTVDAGCPWCEPIAGSPVGFCSAK
ncbi:MAG TPA: hypothetical protein VK034_12900 [Enhygromyxa sp.]|nr:hypothetical protein [Enhygromyxa sp.]